MQDWLDLNTLDWIILALWLAFLVRGVIRGLVAEVLGLIATVVGFVIALIGLKFGAQLLLGLGVNLPPWLLYLLVFIVIWTAIILLFKLTAKAIESLLKALHLNWVNRIGGGAVSFLKGGIIISLLLLLFSVLPFGENPVLKFKDKSRLFPFARAFAVHTFSVAAAWLPVFQKELVENLPGKQEKVGQNLKKYFEDIPPA